MVVDVFGGEEGSGVEVSGGEGGVGWFGRFPDGFGRELNKSDQSRMNLQ